MYNTCLYIHDVCFSNLNSLVNQLLLPLEGSFAIEVRRSHLLNDALKEAKKKFSPMKTMRVCNLSTTSRRENVIKLGF